MDKARTIIRKGKQPGNKQAKKRKSQTRVHKIVGEPHSQIASESTLTLVK